MRNTKKLRVIIIIAAVILFSVPVYAEDQEDYTIVETIIGEETEVDLSDFLNFFMNFTALEEPEHEPSPLTPPGNLTLVDDLSGVQSEDKQFITVITKNGHYFYIIIDRAGNRDNVHFLNLVDEYDLLQILQGEDAESPVIPLATETVTAMPEEIPEQTQPSEETPAPQPRHNDNTMQIIITASVIAAAGGGALYYFKIVKPKRGKKKDPVQSELDEFDFDADENELFIIDTDEPDNVEYGIDEELLDFTAINESADNTEPESENKE
jgi:hypothetical protein